MKRLNGISLYTVSLLLLVTFTACKTADNDSDSSSMLARKTDDKLTCRSGRTQPLVAFSLWSPVTTNNVTCDAKFRDGFLPNVRKVYTPHVIEYFEFSNYYPPKNTGEWKEDRIGSAMDAAVASNPDCPMILFNISCFDMDRAFENGCGTNFDPTNQSCITAFEVNRILSSKTLFAATIWYETQGSTYRKLTAKEIRAKFEKYFPEHWQ